MGINFQRALFLLSFLFLASCALQAETPPYLPPTSVHPAVPYAFSQTAPSPQPTQVCSNDLVYLEDLTIPDYSSILPGITLEKQWRVLNAGTCDWGPGYHLQLVSGSSLGAKENQALVPTASGSETIISLTFTAPLTPGEYNSTWQAFDPFGNPFGPILFMTILVQP